ncbi:hypothetical protein Celaphus_00014268 [Cervus elaphus hippelaphus]|uniref:Uncharacterized protein n=1 Tax=Cervus elaphus hippelaphus TaxID=46360 RepID=A0A212D5K6_CEREH|nr:hypothetical protein Celaphus_00014268 [Cervus elaphus hippelaphus]
MVHFYRLHFSCHIDWSKGDHHARFENTSLHVTHRDSTNTTDLIDILERQTQGFVSWPAEAADGSGTCFPKSGLSTSVCLWRKRRSCSRCDNCRNRGWCQSCSQPARASGRPIQFTSSAPSVTKKMPGSSASQFRHPGGRRP